MKTLIKITLGVLLHTNLFAQDQSNKTVNVLINHLRKDSHVTPKELGQLHNFINANTRVVYYEAWTLKKVPGSLKNSISYISTVNSIFHLEKVDGRKISKRNHAPRYIQVMINDMPQKELIDLYSKASIKIDPVFSEIIPEVNNPVKINSVGYKDLTFDYVIMTK